MRRWLSGLRGKFFLLFLALMLLLVGGIGFAAYRISVNNAVGQFSGLSRDVAEMAAGLIPADRVEGWLEGGPDGEYARTYGLLRDLMDAFGVKYLYASVPFGDGDTMYVFDVCGTGGDPAECASLGDTSGPVDVYGLVMRVYETGEALRDGVITDSSFGYLISSYVPLARDDGTVIGWVGADIDMAVLLGQIRSQTVAMLSISAGIVLTIAALLLAFVNRQILRPIGILSSAMRSFVSGGDRLSNRRVELKTRDELETMADDFNRMSEDIAAFADNLARATADRERIETELNVATRIQSSMLPRTFPPYPDRPEIDIFATMEPAKEVGGDFYDFFLIDEGHLGLVVADVSGKGIPAALFMVTARTLIKNQAQLGKSPAEVFRSVNNMLAEENDAGMFVTAFMAVLSLRDGKLACANAGHNPPLLCRAGGAFEWLKAKPSLFLGAMPDVRYRQFELTLGAGDRLFLYTDGVTEALDRGETLYGNRRLIDVLDKCRDLGAEELIRRVKADVDDFAGGAEQADDITMLSLTYRGIAEAELAVPARRELLDRVQEFVDGRLEAAGCPGKARRQIAVALEELFVNVASYAYGDGEGEATVRVAVEPSPRRARIALIDRGAPFDPLAQAQPDTAAGIDARGIGGLGIHMARKMMDSIDYRYEDGRNIVTMYKAF